MIKDLNDLTQDSLDAKEISASSIRDLAKQMGFDAVKQANEEWEAKLASEQESRTEQETKRKEAEAKIQEQEAKLSQLEEEIASLRAEAAKTAKDQLFQERMSEISENYELDEEKSKVIASQVKALDDSDEAFEAWKKGFVVLASSFVKKEVEEVVEEEVAPKETAASVEEDLESKIDDLNEELAASIPNSVKSLETEDFKTALAKSMGVAV